MPCFDKNALDIMQTSIFKCYYSYYCYLHYSHKVTFTCIHIADTLIQRESNYTFDPFYSEFVILILVFSIFSFCSIFV